MIKKGLCEICNPKQWKTISSDMLTENGYPVYGANGVIGYYTSYNHEEPTILITCRGATCGTLNICEPFSYVNGNAMALDNLSEEVDIRYLYYYLLSRGLSDVITGSAQPQIVRQSLAKVKVMYPPLAEQRKIAAVLDKVGDLIAKRRQQLDKLDELVKSRFLGEFHRRGFPEYELAEVCSKITDGTHKTPHYQDEGVVFISAKNIVDGKIDYSDVKYISEDEYEEIQRRCGTERGDLLLSKSGTLGTVALFDDNIPVGLFESLAVIKYNREILNGVFLRQQLQSSVVQEQLVAGTKGVAVKHLHLNVIGKVKVVVPPLDEQEQFAAFVAQTDKSKLAIQKSLDKLEILKKALMQKYFG